MIIFIVFVSAVSEWVFICWITTTTTRCKKAPTTTSSWWTATGAPRRANPPSQMILEISGMSFRWKMCQYLKRLYPAHLILLYTILSYFFSQNSVLLKDISSSYRCLPANPNPYRPHPILKSIWAGVQVRLWSVRSPRLWQLHPQGLGAEEGGEEGQVRCLEPGHLLLLDARVQGTNILTEFERMFGTLFIEKPP